MLISILQGSFVVISFVLTIQLVTSTANHYNSDSAQGSPRYWRPPAYLLVIFSTLGLLQG